MHADHNAVLNAQADNSVHTQSIRMLVMLMNTDKRRRPMTNTKPTDNESYSKKQTYRETHGRKRTDTNTPKDSDRDKGMEAIANAAKESNYERVLAGARLTISPTFSISATDRSGDRSIDRRWLSRIDFVFSVRRSALDMDS